MLNKIILIGRLVRDPDLKYTGQGTPVCNFTLAVERSYSNKDGDRDVDFIDIVTWRNQAETCAKHLGKGRLVAVDGSLQIRKNKKGDRTYINPEVQARDVRFLDWPNDSKEKDQGYNGPGPAPADELLNDDDFDVPF